MIAERIFTYFFKEMAGEVSSGKAWYPPFDELYVSNFLFFIINLLFDNKK